MKVGRASNLWRYTVPLLIALFTISAFWHSHKVIESSGSPPSLLLSPKKLQHGNINGGGTIDDPVYQIHRNHMLSAPQPVCLRPDCLVDVGRSLARAYPERQKESWCIPTESRGENSFHDGLWQGLLLVKVPKAASSTSAGLTLRLANRTKCAAQFEHREASNYRNRSIQSFLFGSVRMPAARCLSSVWFFMLAPLGIEPTDMNIIRSLHTHRGGKTKGKGGYQFVYLSLEDIEPRSVWTPHSPTHVIDPSAVHKKVYRLLQSYDFMIVVERMDESLTALALITGSSLADVLITSSKVAGSYLLVRVGKDAGHCRRQLKGELSEGVRNYTESDEWLAMNYADEILYRAANASLDRTIEQLGRERFDRSLDDFKQLKEKVLSACGSRLGYGCSDKGEPLPEEQCYLRDFGCGYSCVDSIVDV